MVDFKFSERKWLYLYTLVVGAVVLLCIFPPDIIWARRLSDYTVHIMIGLLVIGLFGLLLDVKHFMFINFGYCGLLCLFLKGTVNQDIRLPSTSGAPSISIMHINLSKANLDYSQLTEYVERSQVDVVSFNEVTPDWEYFMDSEILDVFPYSAKLVRVDPFGLALYSRVPIADIDTIEVYGGDRPHLQVGISFGLGKELSLISSYFLPPLTRTAYGNYRVELTQLGQQIKSIRGPVLAMGDYNLSDWSNEMREYKTLSGLISSRRDVSPGSNTGVKNLLDFPNDHILFNNLLECIEFTTLNDSLGQHIGIKGEYQLKNEKQLKLLQ